MPLLVVKSGSRTGQKIELLAGTTRLGRDPANDYCFDDATVSSHHCEITLGNDLVQVIDLDSTNGTSIESQPVKKAVLLPGQTLHLGQVELVFEDAPVQIAIPALAVTQASPFLPDGALACVNHSGSHATMECTQCRKTFCELCVHQVRRVGGAALKLCPSCSGHCRAIVPEKIRKKRKSLLGAWLGKVTATIKGS